MKQILYALLILIALSSCRGDETATESKPILDSPKYTIPGELRDQLEKSEFIIN